MLVAKSGCLFLVKLQLFMINGNDRVCDELCGTICLQFKAVMKSVHSKASGLIYKHKAFTINGSDGVSAGVCLW